MVELKTVETVDTSPFKKLVVTIGELPTSFVESMTYYELLAWFTDYLQNTIIPAVNNNAEAVTELQEKFVELKTFVDTYFDNLDVQEEINNKLDEMAEDGTLQEIITTYIQANVTWTFDTVADMKASTNLIAGSYARTLGYRDINDGGGALYHITDTGTADEMTVIAVDNLYANLVYNGEVKPEQLGCYNDQIHDDATYIQKAIDLSKQLGVKVNFAHSEYYVLTGINIPQEFSIDFQFITLKAMVPTAFTKGMINIELTYNIHNGVISNLKLDQNNTAPKGIYINRSWRRTYENIDIKNTPASGYGIYLDGTNGGAGGNQFNNITGSGNYRYSTFIYVGVNDCVFSHVDYQQYTTGIEVSGFVRLFDVHGYVATDSEFPDDWYTGSIFIKINSGRIMADELYPDTQNYCFYNYSVIPSQIGKIFFTFNENTSQNDIPSVMFKANNDNVEIYYRWKVESLMLAIGENVLFELIKNSPTSTLSSYLHLGSITGAGVHPIDKPPVYVVRILPMDNFTKLGIYDGTLIATGACQYGTTSSTRDVCRANIHSGYKLIDGYYSFKGINPSTSEVFDGTIQVENNIVTILPNTNQGANFQFFIQVPTQEIITS